MTIGNQYKVDLIGRTFGRLLVIKPTNKRERRRIVWECKCSCGNKNTILVNAARLLANNVQSCGCLHKETSKRTVKLAHLANVLPDGQAAINSLYLAYQRDAKKRDLCFELSKEEFKELTSKSCQYCGREPFFVRKHKNGNYIYNGIDRVDNNIGYILDNVVSCCRQCNIAKMSNSLEDFKEWIKLVYRRTICNVF